MTPYQFATARARYHKARAAYFAGLVSIREFMYACDIWECVQKRYSA